MKLHHLLLIVFAGALLWIAIAFALKPFACSQETEVVSRQTPEVQLGECLDSQAASVSSSIPPALGDPALPEDPPTRATLSEPAPFADSPSLPSEAKEQASLSTLEGDLGKWWKDYLKTPRTGPWQKIPADATEYELRVFAHGAQEIILEQDAKNARLLKEFVDDIVLYSRDERVRQNDRDRQEKLRNLLNSIWPGAMP